LDVPPPPAKNIELTVYLLNAKMESAGGNEIPTEITDVVEQIKSIFPYESFKLWETIPLRTRDAQSGLVEGPKWVKGMISNDTADISDLEYHFSFHSALAIPDQEGRYLARVNVLGMEILRVVTAEGGSKGERTPIVSMRTDIDVKEGQKVVVGKANIGAEEGALFLVVTAKVE
jgi:hypothetical protein